MVKYIIKRTFYLFFVLLGLSIIVFTMARVMPGEPVRMALGTRAPEWVVQKAIEEHHLNEPIYKQYYYWFRNILHGNLGTSWVTGREVIEDIKTFFPASFELIMYSVVAVCFFGILIGAFTGWNNNTWIDNIFRFITYIGISVPPFIFAILFLVIFGMMLKVLPSAGRLSEGVVPPPTITHLITIDALLTGNFNVFFDAIKHLIIPAISLSLKPIIETSRLARVGIIENLKRDYIILAKSYGLPNRLIILKYLLKPSIIPTISILGLLAAQLMVTGFIIENVFNWPGLSRYGLNAILNKDLNSIIAVILVVGTIFIISNVFIDIFVRWLDPRITIREGI